MSLQLIHLDDNNRIEELVPIVYENKSLQLRDNSDKNSLIEDGGNAISFDF
jgi:hypothetical protein